MEIIAIIELKRIILTIISSTINIYRSPYENNLNFKEASDEEVIRFIKTIPYFGKDVKKILTDYFPEVDAIIIDEDWQREFVARIQVWAHSCKWLSDDAFDLDEFSSDSSKFFIPILSLPSFSKNKDRQ